MPQPKSKALILEKLTTERRHYTFIGKGAVYDWLSAYAGHDRWAKAHIRKWRQA